MNTRKPAWILLLGGILTGIWYLPTLFPKVPFFPELRFLWIGFLVGFLGGDYLKKEGVTTQQQYYEQEEKPRENLPERLEKPKTPTGKYTVINTQTKECYTPQPVSWNEANSILKLRTAFNSLEPIEIKEIT